RRRTARAALRRPRRRALRAARRPPRRRPPLPGHPPQAPARRAREPRPPASPARPPPQGPRRRLRHAGHRARHRRRGGARMSQPPDAARVLIVDDAIENLRFLAEVLERRGLEVVAAPSGEVALELLRELDVQIAVIDLVMPGMDGLTLCRELRRVREPAPPVLFVSG